MFNPIRSILSSAAVLALACVTAAVGLAPESAAAASGAAEARPGKALARVAPEPREDGGVGTTVIGGYEPHPSQWPWIARLSMGCGGTLIRPTVIVTAAHCVTDDAGRLSVRQDGVTATLGRRILSDTSTGEQIVTSKIVVHEGYVAWNKNRPDDPRGMINDVALLRLSRPSTRTPAAIGDENDWRLATAMGWGRTGPGAGPQSDRLWAVDLPLQSDAYCAPRSPAGYDGRVMLCAGGVGRGTYKGDSGGPLMVGDGFGGGWELIGITSFGDPGGDVNSTPSYFAWAAGPTLRPWIVRKADELARMSDPAPGPTPGPNPAGPLPQPQPQGDSTSPALMTVAMSPNRFKSARRGPSVAAVGTTVRYRVSEAARVTFSVVRCGRRRGCRRRVTKGRIVHNARAGFNRFGFTGRLRGRRLRPGSYRLVVRAIDSSGNRSVAESLAFRIVR